MGMIMVWALIMVLVEGLKEDPFREVLGIGVGPGEIVRPGLVFRCCASGLELFVDCCCGDGWG